MSHRWKFFLLLNIWLLIGWQAVAQQRKIEFRGLELTVRKELGELKAPGASLAVISGDRVVLVKSFGVADIETRSPVTPDMLFRIASDSKMLTAAALVSLAEKGRVNLNESIGTYAEGLDPRLSRLTLHQLLSHTAGMRDDASDFGLHDDSSLADFVRTWTGDYLFTEPGKIFSYSNLGYDLAGFVLEKAAGKSYPDAMLELLFEPLGMKHTTVRPLMAMTYPFSRGHKPGPDGSPVVVRPFADEARQWPSGGVFTSVVDYARFVIAFMNDGKIEGRQVLPEAVVAKLSMPYADSPSGKVDEHPQYSYGLNVINYHGLRALQHGGSVAGFGALLRMVPERRFAVIILSNRTGALLIKSMEKATQLALKLNPGFTEPPDKPLQMTEGEMLRYVGAYVNNPAYLSVEILMKDGRLYLRQSGSDRMSPVIKIGDHRFSNEGTHFVLIPGNDGRIEYLHIVGHALKKVQTDR